MKFTVTSPVQPEKAEDPQSVTEGGMVIVVNPEQREKAWLPMVDNPCGRVNDVRALQFRKAHFSMLFTLFGRVTDVKPVQPLKAPPGMLFTLSPIFTVVIEVQLENMPILVDVQLSALKFTVTRPVQPEKAEAPQSVTEGGMVIVVRPVQF